MKCWKCGADIPSDASVCTYCSISMTRKNTITNTGTAMRQVYDHFGCEKVFEKKSILPIALGDLLENSKKLRAQIDMAMSCGVGTVYINQLRNAGTPDTAFCTRIKTLLTEDAGLSDKAATELMGYFDEMIGWNVPVQSTTQTGSNTAHRPNPNQEIPRPNPSQEIPRPNPNKEIPRPTPNKEIPRPTPTPTPPRPDPVKPPVNKPDIPLPTGSVPLSPAGPKGETFLVLLFFGGAIGCLCAGLIPLAAASGLFYLLLCHKIGQREKGIIKKITHKKTAAGLELSWDGEIPYAIAVGYQWVLTGTGDKVTLNESLFSQYKPGKKIRITLVQVLPTGGIDFRGKVEFQQPK